MSIRSFKGVQPKLGARVFIDPAGVVIGDVCLGMMCRCGPAQ